jgi:hypothetical protein
MSGSCCVVAGEVEEVFLIVRGELAGMIGDDHFSGHKITISSPDSGWEAANKGSGRDGENVLPGNRGIF